ncbi:MAG: N-acetylmuramoyl-L-alanine amidase [Alphaproteobacteria bacterium]|nr:N-acetylmuramoyl-L-alanine amidase [Alphaproteobacteria bacterium]
MGVTVLERPSPNHEARPEGAAIDTLILHYTGMKTAEEALKRLCDPAAKVSAHYLIDEGGRIYALVPEGRRAWHAGEARWQGETDINDRSIGVELVNPGHDFGYRPFPEAQMAALEALLGGILARHPIPAARVLGHSDVAPARKTDPGELFDWERLARAGIGHWPEARGETPVPPVGEIQRRLGRYGYDVPLSGEADAATKQAITAFQRHFRPERVDGEADGETAGRLAALLEGLDPPTPEA